MIHLNGNLIVSIDVETTGFTSGFHDIWQVAVLLLDYDLKPDKRVIPFYVNMKPKRMQNIDPSAVSLNRLNFAQKMKNAMDPYDAADHFDDWFENLKKETKRHPPLLPEGKKLIPLAQNWVFDRGFIIDWLGQRTFDSLFFPWYRDTLPVAQFMNDQYSKRPECMAMDYKVPFPKSNLKYLCSQYKVKNVRAHDALQDTIATAEVYRLMVTGAAVG
jgi:DNA polymerase III epsilon subunit-like protein